MADTLKFGPEWLRQLSGGNNVGTPPPSPAPGFGKYKLADYRYGREEMLALYTRSESMPEELRQFTPIVTDKSQEPLAMLPPSEEEQRIMSQSVNSAAVLRMMGRSAPPMRGRGSGVDRGRGRGRGRGDGYMPRGMSYDDMESGGGGFGHPRQRPDGSWDEGGQKPYQRSYSSRFDDAGAVPPNKMYQRSLSSENWRDREEDDDGGDWRKAGGAKWGNARGSWRDRGNRDGGFEYDRPHPGLQKGYSRQYRTSESWEEEEMPEWSTDADLDELGTFDASGAFVSTKPPALHKGRRPDPGEGEYYDEGRENKSQRSPTQSPPHSNRDRTKEMERKNSGERDINENQTKKAENNRSKPDKLDSQRPSSVPDTRQTAQFSDNKNQEKSKPDKSKSSPIASDTSMPKTEPPTQKKNTDKSQAKKSSESEKKKVDNSSKKSESSAKNREDVEPSMKPVNSKVPKETTNGSKRREKLKSEAEALDQLQETVETMVAGITVMDDEVLDEEVEVSGATSGVKSSPGALPPDHENYNKWFYRDPQGDLQGPFTSNEMSEWFSAGYFTMNLLVRRGCDEKYLPLGELIKRWGRVPFIPGPSPPPMKGSAHTSPDVTKQQQQQQQQIQQQQEQLQALQQQYLLQQQLVQQQMLMRHMQLQQLQQVMNQLQENESFKSLPLLQQQQLAMQMLLKQQPQLVPQQPPKQQLSPRSNEAAVSSSSTGPSSHPSFNRSYSSPNNTQPQSGQPASIWDLETGPGGAAASGQTATDIEAQIKEKLEQQQIEERKYQEELERQKEELRKQQEEIQRQKEHLERERMEMERKKQQELQKIEEERRKTEEVKMRLEEEQRKKFEEEKRQLEEEERMRAEEEMRRHKEMERQRQQELQKKQQEELQREKEMKEREKQRQLEEREKLKQQQQQQQQQQLQLQQQEREQQELQRRQDAQRLQQEESLRKQQQEALRKLQQEQLANMQLPSHAQWGSNQMGGGGGHGGKSLLEIQQQEETDRLEREEMQRRQLEVQRQQMLALQQQQQQQKSWTNAMLAGKGNSTKSLLEIQEEQARQLERERQKREENQQQAVKNLSLGAASVWSTSPSSTSWANEGAWGALRQAGGDQMNALNANNNSNNNNNNSNLGFWDDAIISSGPVKKHQSSKQGKQQNAEFPALGGDGKQRGGGGGGKQTSTQNKANKPSKSKKEEEAVQRLFQSVKLVDDFTQWCEKQLRNMATSVDIPTFIAFLQEVESPYEVHDYVRSYLGETKAADDFGKAFLEKRSQYRHKTKPVVQEDSIWGPAPAVTPRELRQPIISPNDDGMKGKANKKKKNKMMKIDASILGFTVHADTNRIVGEIEEVGAGANTR